MRRIYLFSVLWLFVARGVAEEALFKVQFPAVDGSLTEANLSFEDANKQVVVRVSDGRMFAVPYQQIDNMSYEYTRKHRIKNGVEVALLSPGTGAIIALTKSRNHWLEINFRKQDVPGVLIVKLDKRNYRQVCQIAKLHTGKEVALLGQTTAQSIKGKLEK